MDNPAAPISSTSPQLEVSPTESPNRRWLLWLIGGAVLLGLGIVLGLFSAKFFNQSQNLSQLTPTNSTELPPQSLTPTLIPDPTANWKTYKNEKEGIEFNYPPDYQVSYKPFQTEIVRGNPKYCLQDNGEVKGVIATSLAYRIWSSKWTYISEDDFHSLNSDLWKELQSSSGSYEITLIGGKRAVREKLESLNEECPASIGINYYIYNGNSLVGNNKITEIREIKFSYLTHDPDRAQIETTIAKILSTLKFLDQNE